MKNNNDEFDFDINEDLNNEDFFNSEDFNYFENNNIINSDDNEDFFETEKINEEILLDINEKNIYPKEDYVINDYEFILYYLLNNNSSNMNNLQQNIIFLRETGDINYNNILNEILDENNEIILEKKENFAKFKSFIEDKNLIYNKLLSKEEKDKFEKFFNENNISLVNNINLKNENLEYLDIENNKIENENNNENDNNFVSLDELEDIDFPNNLNKKNYNLKKDIFSSLIENELNEITLMALFKADIKQDSSISLEYITNYDKKDFNDLRTLEILERFKLKDEETKSEIIRSYNFYKLKLMEEIKKNQIDKKENYSNEEKENLIKNIKKHISEEKIKFTTNNYKKFDKEYELSNKNISLNNQNEFDMNYIELIENRNFKLEFETKLFSNINSYLNKTEQLLDNKKFILEENGEIIEYSTEGINSDQKTLILDTLGIIKEQENKKELIILDKIIPNLTIFGNYDNVSPDDIHIKNLYYDKLKKSYENNLMLSKNDLITYLNNNRLNNNNIFNVNKEEQLYSFIYKENGKEIIKHGTKKEIDKYVNELNRKSDKSLKDILDFSTNEGIYSLLDKSNKEKPLNTQKLLDGSKPIIMPLFKNNIFDNFIKDANEEQLKIIENISKEERISLYSYISNIEIPLLVNGIKLKDRNKEKSINKIIDNNKNELMNFIDKDEEKENLKLKIKEDITKNKVEIIYSNENTQYNGMIKENSKSKILNENKEEISNEMEKIETFINNNKINQEEINDSLDNLNSKLNETSSIIKKDLEDDNLVEQSNFNKMNYLLKEVDTLNDEDLLNKFNKLFMNDEFEENLKTTASNLYYELSKFNDQRLNLITESLRKSETSQALDQKLILSFICGGWNLLPTVTKDLFLNYQKFNKFMQDENLINNKLENSVKELKNKGENSITKSLIKQGFSEQDAKTIADVAVDIKINKKGKEVFKVILKDKNEIKKILQKMVTEGQNAIDIHSLSNLAKGEQISKWKNSFEKLKNKLLKDTENKITNELKEQLPFLKSLDNEQEEIKYLKEKELEIIKKLYIEEYDKNNGNININDFNNNIIDKLSQSQSSEIEKKLYKAFVDNKRYFNFDKNTKMNQINNINTFLIEKIKENLKNDNNFNEFLNYLDEENKNKLINKINELIEPVKFSSSNDSVNDVYNIIKNQLKVNFSKENELVNKQIREKLNEDPFNENNNIEEKNLNEILINFLNINEDKIKRESFDEIDVLNNVDTFYLSDKENEILKQKELKKLLTLPRYKLVEKIIKEMEETSSIRKQKSQVILNIIKNNKNLINKVNKNIDSIKEIYKLKQNGIKDKKTNNQEISEKNENKNYGHPGMM